MAGAKPRKGYLYNGRKSANQLTADLLEVNLCQSKVLKLDACFKRTETDEPVRMNHAMLRIFDLDHQSNAKPKIGPEVVQFNCAGGTFALFRDTADSKPPYVSYNAGQPTESDTAVATVKKLTYTCPVDRVTVWSSMEGTDADNPADTSSLTPHQEQKSLLISFKDVECAELTFGILPNQYRQGRVDCSGDEQLQGGGRKRRNRIESSRVPLQEGNRRRQPAERHVGAQCGQLPGPLDGGVPGSDQWAQLAVHNVDGRDHGRMPALGSSALGSSAVAATAVAAVAAAGSSAGPAATARANVRLHCGAGAGREHGPESGAQLLQRLVGGRSAVTAPLAAVVARQPACGHVPRGLPAGGGRVEGAQPGVARRRQPRSRRQSRRVRPSGGGLVHDGRGQAHAVACAGRGLVRHVGGGLAGDGAPGSRRRASTGHGVLRRGRGRVPRLLPQRAGGRVRVLVRRWRHHDDLVQAAARAALLRRLLLDGRATRGAAAAAAAAAYAAVLRERVG